MHIFPHFSKEQICKVCGTNEDKPCILAPIDGTIDDMNERATVVHLDCVIERIRYNDDAKVLYVRAIRS